jgi:hypothetical protein
MMKYQYYLTVIHADLEVTTAGEVSAKDEKAAVKAVAKLTKDEVVKIDVHPLSEEKED